MRFDGFYQLPTKENLEKESRGNAGRTKVEGMQEEQQGRGEKIQNFNSYILKFITILRCRSSLKF